jgi:hypothetical protein
MVRLRSIGGKSYMALFRTSCLAVFLFAILAISCAAAQDTDNTDKGLWLSDGYGLLLDIDKDELHAFELTSISCIPGWSAKLSHDFQSAKERVFVGKDTFRLSDGPTADVKRLHLEGAASDIVLHRTGTDPAMCSQRPDNSPPGNYAVFWQTFAEHYAFFALRQVDWQEVDRNFRPRVSASTKPDQLFEIFRQMIEPLHDAHTGIEAQDSGKEFDGWRNDPNHLESEQWKRAEAGINGRYIRGGLRSFCNRHVQFGMLDQALGYLRITAFYGYVDQYTYASALRALQSALDAIFRDAQTWKGLVVDVRLNHGGDDPLGIEIASRLTGRKYLAYSKVTRNNLNGALHFTKPQETWVLPSTGPGFHGNVALLIGPDTVSAGETFAMATGA